MHGYDLQGQLCQEGIDCLRYLLEVRNWVWLTTVAVQRNAFLDSQADWRLSSSRRLARFCR